MFEMIIPNKAFQKKFKAMKDNVHPHGAAHHKNGGAIGEINVPPTDTLTKRIPIVA